MGEYMIKMERNKLVNWHDATSEQEATGRVPHVERCQPMRMDDQKDL